MGRGRKRRHRKSGGGVTSSAIPPETSAGAFLPVAPVEARTNGHIKTELVPVRPEDVEVIWPLAEALLEPELPNIDWTAEQLRYACVAGDATLWMICDMNTENAVAAMVTVLSPQGRCLVSICCGNSLWDYLEARHQLYDWAKEQGMKEVTFFGRDALVKLMPECKRGGVILRKEL